MPAGVDTLFLWSDREAKGKQRNSEQVQNLCAFGSAGLVIDGIHQIDFDEIKMVSSSSCVYLPVWAGECVGGWNGSHGFWSNTCSASAFLFHLKLPPSRSLHLFPICVLKCTSYPVLISFHLPFLCISFSHYFTSWGSRPSCTFPGPNSDSAIQVAPAEEIGAVHHLFVDWR